MCNIVWHLCSKKICDYLYISLAWCNSMLYTIYHSYSYCRNITKYTFSSILEKIIIFLIFLKIIYFYFQNLTGISCNSLQPSSDTKKTSVKYSNWKHGLVQFLKKKRHGGQRHGSQNNNDSFRSNNHTLLTTNSSNRNGHARCSYKPIPKSDDTNLEAETQFLTNSLPVRPGVWYFVFNFYSQSNAIDNFFLISL